MSRPFATLGLASLVLASLVLAACGNSAQPAATGDQPAGYVDPNSPGKSGVASTAPTLGQPADPNRPPAGLDGRVSQGQTAVPTGQSVTPNGRQQGDSRPGPASDGDGAERPS